MDWILAHPDWENELPSSTQEETDQPESAEAESIPVEPKKPLTDEEKQERALALQERLNKAREKRLEEEKREKIEREKSRRKEGKEIGNIKQDYNERMMKKQAEERKRQKLADAQAKKRVQEQVHLFIL